MYSHGLQLRFVTQDSRYMKHTLDFNKANYNSGKKETNSYCSVSPMQPIAFFFCSLSPTAPSSLESISYQSYQRVLSGQAIFKNTNVCVCVLLLLQ